jgi:hypothetical protein
VLCFRINLLENDSIAASIARGALAHFNYSHAATGCNLLHLVYLNIVTKRGKGRGYLERLTDCCRLAHGGVKRCVMNPLTLPSSKKHELELGERD